MKFKKVRWKNILSYGNSWTEYEFKPGLTHISGPIGSGKSTIIDVLNFALFGTPYRKVNIPNLVNQINKKGLLVELILEVNGKEVKIIRGLKPNRFEIYVNSELVTVESHKKQYQKLLEEILGINESLFNQLIVKSLSKGTSFFSLSKGEKRKIIETLFNIHHFSKIREIVKEKLTKLNHDLEVLEKEIEYTVLMFEQERKHIEELKEKLIKEQEEKNKEEIQKITSQIKDLEKQKQKIEEKLQKKDQYLQKQKDVLNKLQKYERVLNSLTSKQELLSIFEDECKECQVYKKILKKLNIDFSKIEKTKSQIEKLSTRKDKLDEKIEKFKKLELNLQKINYVLTQLNSELKKLNKIENVDIDTSKLDELNEKYQELKFKKDQIKQQIFRYEVLYEICGDNGIKKIVIKQYLPLLNSLLFKFLEKLRAGFKIEITEDLVEKVSSRFKESFSYFNFSEGQKRIIDIAILLAFIEFVKIKSGLKDINLLIIDEITAGLDSETEELFSKLLSEIAKQEGKEIIIMSHLYNGEYDRKFEVQIEKGFSKLKKVF